MRLALVGMPGSGKSTVGRRLAKRLGAAFVDSDLEIERRLNCSIKVYFDRFGEGAFREQEQQVIAELTDGCGDLVLATGGGAVLSAPNRACLHERMTVIYLRSLPEDLMRRLRYDQSRPLLQVADPLRRLQELFAQRDPLYREVAHCVVDTGQPSVSSLVNLIVSRLGADTEPRKM